MRKLLIVLAAVAVAMAFSATAMAGITGSAHEDATVTGGPCANCHLPHGAVAGGERLWPANPTTGSPANITGTISNLCAYCHNTAGGKAITYPGANSDTYVYGTNSHGVLMSTANNPRSQLDSGLDYDGADGQIECTTCHNVHEDPTGSGGTGYRPFLRADINSLCAGCHDQRMYDAAGPGFIGGAAALTGTIENWGANYGLANPGGHPVGGDVTGNNNGGNTPVTIPAEMSIPFDASVAGWDLGGHLTAGGTGGVTCTTCHAVHGIEADATGNNPAIADTIPNANFLAVYQTSTMQDTGNGNRSIANGLGDFNALCEACHTGAAVDAFYGSDAVTYNPNPGGTAFGHPVDDMAANGDWVTAFPAGGWPTGDPAIAGSNVTPTPICESCHVAHPAANITRNDETASGDFTNSEYILRNTAQIVCEGCHTGTISGNSHHPVGITFDANNVTYLTQLAAGGQQTLQCGVCHGGGSGGAHNWNSVAELSMDPNWIPVNNGRSSTPAVDRYNAEMSITCMDCHYGIDGNAATKSPTKHDGLIYNGANEANFNVIGNDTGTHYIGVLQAGWTTLGAQIAPQADTWGSALGGNGGWSRFGIDAATPVLVCESCHELQPTKNAGVDSHLLLGTFVEEDAAAITDTHSDFCEACHLPPGTHPLTGTIVTRTGVALDTNIAGKAWLNAPTDTNVVMNQTDNIITCDSCHQVHDANDNSYTFILDTAAANVGTPQAPATTNAEAGTYVAAYVTAEQAGKGGPHNRFCNQCHPYN